DVGAGEVAGQQVWRELDTTEARVHAAGQRLDGGGLGQTGQAFDEYVTTAQQADDEAVEQGVLADDAAGERFAQRDDARLERRHRRLTRGLVRPAGRRPATRPRRR